jgi:hypothetical protein
MVMHVGHSTAMKSMLVKGIMFAVQPEAPISDVNKYISVVRFICFVFSSLFFLDNYKMSLGEITFSARDLLWK